MEDNVFEKGSYKLNYIKLALPLVFSLVMNVVYNMADTYFIAWTQNTNLVAAVSLCAPVFMLLMAFGNIFGQGGSCIVSQLIGGNNAENAKKVSVFSFYIALLIGVVCGFVMILFQNPILNLLGADADTLSYAKEYFVWLAVGAPFIVCNFVHTNLLRSEGKPGISMVGSIGGALVNIILDPIFITVLGMGAKGAAIATVIGNASTVVFCFIIVKCQSRFMSVNVKYIAMPKMYFGTFFGVGVSAAITNIMQSICLVVVNKYLYAYGNQAIAAMGIAYKVSMIAFLIITGFTFGGQPIISYFYGAKKMDILKDLLKFAFTFMAILAAVLTVILEIVAPWIIGAFLKDATVITMGTAMFRWLIAALVCVSFVQMSSIVFQALGKVVASLIMSVSRQGVVFFVVILILANVAGYTGVLISQTVADVISTVLAAVLFIRTMRQEQIMP